MASLAGVASRASARLVGSRLATRGFTSWTQRCAAQNFVMPALSPTMTEGNIATWKVKEGDSYSAGDVLLEIETDKATMDVEAQEDGIMFKVLAGDGAKSVQVGTRIAVLAEAGDDLKTLEVPAEEKSQQSQDSSAASGSQSAQDADKKTDAGSRKSSARSSSGDEVHEQKYPLMPSVETLVHQNSLSKEEVSRIKPTGPNGRLLKGDVLAYMGSIDTDRPAAVSLMFEKLAHLDLSNIKVAAKKAAAPKEAAKSDSTAPHTPPQTKPLEVNLPVSLSKVIEVQHRIQETLGVFMPLSTFISRAAEVANDKLPPPKRAPTTSELFDQVLGLDKIGHHTTTTRGFYLPQISAVPPNAFSKSPPPPPTPSRLTLNNKKKSDVIDFLAGKPKRASTAGREPSLTTVSGLSSGLNVFSLVVPREEEQRAHLFLERCKAILEEEPGRLVL
ncbi:pyruvate dehydrogenase protein x component [Moelleriella libera RCEF 2490]|uniref:Pyruvate dehydrogenase protein x component n=1 Tax=Moelleriella libera RCEF 2490 TaxID=1081109 RepID=A0A166ULJ0_9HYPO|nr:pyruvate dehydrogenase protein x component [Moelleriella libera RCEF 2490]